jgi:CubicO group peptidase (beta-lactamase class C family)
MRVTAVVVAALVSIVALGAGPHAGPQPGIVQGRAALRALVRHASVPAVSVAVAVEGEVVWSEAFGSANLELGVEADERTRFRIASVSKALTATALMKLAQDGRIDLDAPVAGLGDDLAHLPAGLTLRRLARHTGGVRHYDEGEISVSEHYLTLADAATIFVHDPLRFEPGTRYLYSTFGYTLLGLAMERATGRSFGELMAETLFEPLGMRETELESWYRITPERGAGYEYRDEYGIINAQPSDNSCRVPGGGMLSTARDLVRFGAALLRPGYLTEASLAELFEPTVLEDGSNPGYAMGWRIEQDAWGRPVRRHAGSQPGTRANLVLYPDRCVAVAAIANVSRAPLGFDEVQAIAEPFLDRGGRPVGHGAAMDPVGEYAIFAGDDRGAEPGFTLSVWRDFDGPLLASARVVSEQRRMTLDSVHVRGSLVRIVGLSARVFGGQLVVIEFDAASGEGRIFSGGRLIPVHVVGR